MIVTTPLQNQLVVATVIFVSVWILMNVTKSIIIRRLRQVAKFTKSSWDNRVIAAIEKINWPFYWIIPLYMAAQFIELPQNTYKLIRGATIVVVTYYLVKVFQIIVIKALQKQFIAKQQKPEESKKTIGTFLEITVKAVLWSLAAILVLQNLGYNVSALLGGLGVAGIAVGFALQNVLIDIFAFFSLYFDRPFEVGDFIAIDNDSGTVQKIGIKSTRIKTLTGQELIISNKELTENRVQNFKKMQNRRVAFEFGVTYETPVTKLKKIPNIVANILKSIDKAELSRVHFKTLAESNLIYEIVYIVNSSDYNTFMDIQEDVNLGLIEQMEKHQINFAYPTKTIIVKK